MAKHNKDTEQKILESARNVFIQKGLAGARMQDIADHAGVNKALLHYYFTSKDKLFNIVFEQEFGNFFSSLAQVIASDQPLFEKIKKVVALDIEKLSQFPDMPIFVLNEVSRNPEVILSRLQNIPVEMVLGLFQQQINAEVERGNIRPIAAGQLLVNIQSLCVFPFLARPMLRGLMKMNEEEFKAMIQLRKNEVAEFIINGIKTN
ncbi:MAG TPA: TetR/AcrR family transcriptional regulator [Ferruginibacter sp.]|jgi:AcrR family transcriptional regulator|nr:TetR/AcrR family transcriptional regulator [Chitinophagales bacterium]HMX36891.1 TetR/AcrR family transcriptional regulator [Ferruginibacter sp.]HNA00626.1 TetR/AcrR family transcriptional regulator [Ferruginibacter sp.]HNJ28682.1 TetR/AcrR family transcriptional regulator [Ferruginibacter sp.]HNK27660.1 TetR/AcrR family transcriptional regulator [Ferruginibacter sp.]